MIGSFSLRLRSKAVLKSLCSRNCTLVTAESLTAGLIASSLAGIPGASSVLWGGFITYDRQAKRDILGVPDSVMDEKGVVSGETAAAMAEGALRRSRAVVGLAVTGVAGPGRGAGDPPVGTVALAVSRRNPDGTLSTATRICSFSGSRQRVRRKTVEASFALLDYCLDRQ